MERFAIKIDNALRANLYKICRLCGIDNPVKLPILNENEETQIIEHSDEEPEMSQKICELLGLKVTKNDKMPQTMCSLCVDKINGFYEFREMCYATNIQTRNLLGLKPEEPFKLQKIDVVKDTQYVACGVASENCTRYTKRGNRKRKKDEIICDLKKANVTHSNKKDLTVCSKKKRVTESLVTKAKTTAKAKAEAKLEINKIKDESFYKTKVENVNTKMEIRAEPLRVEINDELSRPINEYAKKNVYKYNCTICERRCGTKYLLEKHKSTDHMPDIPRYVCSACEQTHQTNADIKAHHLWHKFSKAPYKCNICDQPISNNYAFTRHMREHSTITPVELLVLDRECPKCHIAYATNFLYNTHSCAIQTKKCGGCNRNQRNEAEFLRHAPYCAKMYLSHTSHIPADITGIDTLVCIKNENDIEAGHTKESTIIEDRMQPYVSIERMSSPMLRNAIASKCNTNNDLTPPPHPIKKYSKKNSNKNYLKRVDQLLKSTLDTLVSIKHEPEMHVVTEAPTRQQSENCQDKSEDGYENGADSGDVRQTSESDDNASHYVTNMKQERSDEPKQFALKLKITKEHGQLNSSLINNEDDTAYHSKRKKKKKRKDAEKERSKEVYQSSNVAADIKKNSDIATAAASTICVKQEIFEADDEMLENNNNQQQMTTQPDATIMTAIPMEQYQISCLNNIKPYNGASIEQTNQCTELLDMKPNLSDLRRFLHTTHVASSPEISMNTNNSQSTNLNAAIGAITEEASEQKPTSMQTQHNIATEHMSQIARKRNEPSSNTTENIYNNHIIIAEQKTDNNSLLSIKHENESIDNEAQISDMAQDSFVVVKLEGTMSPLEHEAAEPNYSSVGTDSKCMDILLQIKAEPMDSEDELVNGKSDELLTPLSIAGATVMTGNATPYVVAVQNEGINVTSNMRKIQIKQEPTDYSYDDVRAEHEPAPEQLQYINNIDFRNICIKQEKNMMDMQLEANYKNNNNNNKTNSAIDSDEVNEVAQAEKVTKFMRHYHEKDIPMLEMQKHGKANQLIALKTSESDSQQQKPAMEESMMAKSVPKEKACATAELITANACSNDLTEPIGETVELKLETGNHIMSEQTMDWDEASTSSNSLASTSKEATEQSENESSEQQLMVWTAENIHTTTSNKHNLEIEETTSQTEPTQIKETIALEPKICVAIHDTEDTISVSVYESKNEVTKAQPITAPARESQTEAELTPPANMECCNLDSEEEQQNILNQELQNVGEEAENRINEQQQLQLEQEEEHNLLLVQQHFIDDSNINEIAENNNNANIERELQDENHSVSS